jgi:hypothetical protein
LTRSGRLPAALPHHAKGSPGVGVGEVGGGAFGVFHEGEHPLKKGTGILLRANSSKLHESVFTFRPPARATRHEGPVATITMWRPRRELPAEIPPAAPRDVVIARPKCHRPMCNGRSCGIWRLVRQTIVCSTSQPCEPERKHFEVSPAGYGVHWPEIAEDLSIDALIGVRHACPLAQTSAWHVKAAGEPLRQGGLTPDIRTGARFCTAACSANASVVRHKSP